MNLVNELVNKSNYKQYLERMTESVQKSSKGLIPFYASGKTLDVGCGSGVLLDILNRNGVEAEGIDINTEAIKVCHEKGLKAKCIPLDEVKEKYNTIIFSSVLHEFSSYDENNRFSNKPIIDALNAAKNILNDDGKIIIRDGLKGDKSNGYLYVKDIKTVQAFKKFINESPIFSHINKNELFITNEAKITAPRWVLKEFIFTYTWGEESWNREIQEQFGILSKKEWKKVLNTCGLDTTVFTVSGEEYEKYASNIFENNTMLHNILSECTVFIVAKKKTTY